MLVTRTHQPAFLSNPGAFRATAEPAIFEKLDDGYFVVALEHIAEQGEDGQYPMEDVLDEFLCHIEAFDVAQPDHPGGQVDLFANSELPRLAEAVKRLVGRRAYNVETTDEAGETFIGLVIDDSVAEART